jgi:hypothetical protein
MAESTVKEKVVAESAANNGQVKGLVFAIDDITAEQVEDFLVAINGNSIRQQAGIMAALAVSCPKEWGPPNEPETYSKLKFRLFREARELFVEGLNDLGKN